MFLKSHEDKLGDLLRPQDHQGWLGALPLAEGEGVLSTLLICNNLKSPRNHQKSKNINFSWFDICRKEMIDARSDRFVRWLRSRRILICISMMMFLKQLWICDPRIRISRTIFRDSPKSRNTTSESLVRYVAIRELLLSLSEFNVQHIKRSVFKF